MEKPAWVVAVLLLMLAVLMLFHLYLLFVGIQECDDLADIVLEHRRGQFEKGEKPDPLSTEKNTCTMMESIFQEAVDKYMEVILSLLSGAGFAAGVANMARKNGKTDE